jgi:hypothetical protein
MAILAPKDGSPSERIAAAYERLTEASATLNSASDDLGQSIRSLDIALQKLNLGVKAWVRSGGWENPDSTFEDHYLGYAKVGSKWGIALSIESGMRGWEENNKSEGEWLFNDAPRMLRAEAVNALPDLIESLVTAAARTTQDILAKTADAHELASTITAVAKSKK